MSSRQKDGVVAIISGLVTAAAGVVAVVTPIDPVWLAPVIASVGAIMTIIFGVKVVNA